MSGIYLILKNPKPQVPSPKNQELLDLDLGIWNLGLEIWNLGLLNIMPTLWTDSN